MRQLILTGLATEHDLLNGGAEQYFLVFNKTVRIPVPQETAEALIQELYGDGQTQEPTGFTQEDFDRERPLLQAELRGETHARPKPPESGPVLGQVGNTYSDSDDGVESI